MPTAYAAVRAISVSCFQSTATGGAGGSEPVPHWVWFACSLVFVIVAIQSGFLLARVQRRRAGEAKDGEGPIGSVIGSVLGLLAFLLAFTFSIAAGHYEQRKKLVMDEADAIGTAYLRADLLAEAQRAPAQEILRAYTTQRARLPGDVDGVLRVLHDAEKLQDRLWLVVSEASRSQAPQALVALFASSVNQVIDLHSDRVTVGLQYRIPSMIWWSLGLVTLLAMAGVGYQFGLAGRENLPVQALLALSLSAVVWLIANLDEPWGGIKVGQQPLIELAEKIAPPK